MEDILTEFEEKEERYNFLDEVCLIVLVLIFFVPYYMYVGIKFLIRKIYSV